MMDDNQAAPRAVSPPHTVPSWARCSALGCLEPATDITPIAGGWVYHCRAHALAFQQKDRRNGNDAAAHEGDCPAATMVSE
jgi:hypothetical protein